MSRISLTRAVIAPLALAMIACSSDPKDGDPPGPTIEPGDPFPDLPAEELAMFLEGAAAFDRELTPADGLGPVFIERSCVACHAQGGRGGADPLADPNHLVERFGTLDANGAYDPLAALGGDVLQTRSIAGEVEGCDVEAETVPAEATVRALRNPLPMFGIGLIAAISEETILAGAGAKGDGVQGRANLDAEGRPGRFGWKAQTNELLIFNGIAANGTMGLTSTFSPNEQKPRGATAPEGCTNDDLGALSPNDDNNLEILKITAFEVLLAPIAPLEGSEEGEQLFGQIGCAKCHTPSMQTDTFHLPMIGPVEALTNKSAELYSDLLLHDMGPELDEKVVMRQATGRDFRTAPLWGIRLRTRYLHDGRATTIHDAIALHGGEAEIIRDRYLALSEDDRDHLLRFVGSL